VCACVRVVSAVGCAFSLVEMIVRNFASLIKTTMSGQGPSTVDIAAEERSELVVVAAVVIVIRIFTRITEV